MVTGYIVVASDETEDLSERVNGWINSGYEPYGSISVTANPQRKLLGCTGNDYNRSIVIR